MSTPLAGKFETYIPDGYYQQGRKILYICKATAGEFQETDAAHKTFESNHSAFWKFADEISRLADPEVTGRKNVAWSNIFKQGVSKGNPTGAIAHEQREKSVEELRAEVEQLKPNLIVLVTSGYYEEIPKEAFEVLDGRSMGHDGKLHEEKVEGQSHSIWYRATYRNFPPIVWTNHPERKSRDYTDAALRVIAKLMNRQ